MANPRVTESSAQVVHTGAPGQRVRISDSSAQIVQRGSAGGEARVGEASVQVVTTTTAGRVRVGEVFAQTVRQGSTGAVLRETFGALQVVYTTGVADSSRRRAWTFDFDGHTFYVLDLGTAGSLVYDLTTQMWSKFETNGYEGSWDFKSGFHWRTGKMVVGGSTDGATLRRLDEGSFYDEDWRPVTYEVRGLLPAEGIEFHRQYALRLVGSAGQTADTAAPILRMQYSDDQGVSWSVERTIALTQDKRQRIEFRSMGAFTAPGRIFRLYDDGGIKFIAWVEADIGGEDAATPT